jgi:hypothetical protein
VDGDVPLGERLQVHDRHFLTTGGIDDADRAALVGDLLDDPPGLLGVQVKVACLVQAGQDPVGKVANLVGQGHDAAPGRQPASSRSCWIRSGSPARPKLITVIAGFRSSEIA